MHFYLLPIKRCSWKAKEIANFLPAIGWEQTKVRIPRLHLQKILSYLSLIVPFILSLFATSHREFFFDFQLSLTKSISKFHTTKTGIWFNWSNTETIFLQCHGAFFLNEIIQYTYFLYWENKHFLMVSFFLLQLCCRDSPPIAAENPVSLWLWVLAIKSPFSKCISAWLGH